MRVNGPASIESAICSASIPNPLRRSKVTSPRARSKPRSKSTVSHSRNPCEVANCSACQIADATAGENVNSKGRTPTPRAAAMSIACVSWPSTKSRPSASARSKVERCRRDAAVASMISMAPPFTRARRSSPDTRGTSIG